MGARGGERQAPGGVQARELVAVGHVPHQVHEGGGRRGDGGARGIPPPRTQLRPRPPRARVQRGRAVVRPRAHRLGVREEGQLGAVRGEAGGGGAGDAVVGDAHDAGLGDGRLCPPCRRAQAQVSCGSEEKLIARQEVLPSSRVEEDSYGDDEKRWLVLERRFFFYIILGFLSSESAYIYILPRACESDHGVQAVSCKSAEFIVRLHPPFCLSSTRVIS